jgi:hypothetical protein
MTLEYYIHELKRNSIENDKLIILEDIISNKIDRLNVDSPILHIFPIVITLSSILFITTYMFL